MFRSLVIRHRRVVRLSSAATTIRSGVVVRKNAAAGAMRMSAAAASTAANEYEQNEIVQFLRLNNLHDNVGAVKKKRRVGRGIGSSKGKTSGRGHKGQKARSGGSIHPLFEGGQTKLWKRIPKRGFNNTQHATPMLPINIGTIQNYIDMGRIDPTQQITIRQLQLAGLFKANSVKHGVKLLADGKEKLKQPLNIKLSRASQAAINAIESIGNGQVTTVHYNKLALRAILRPDKFDADNLPRFARPTPKMQPYYTSYKNRGYLNPQVQMRTWLMEHSDHEDKFNEILLELKKGKQQQQQQEEEEVKHS